VNEIKLTQLFTIEEIIVIVKALDHYRSYPLLKAKSYRITSDTEHKVRQLIDKLSNNEKKELMEKRYLV